MAVITETRYGGIYEGGRWAAFGVDDPKQVPEAAFGGDPCAVDWWDAPTVPVGVGDDPNDALEHLRFLIDRDRCQDESGFFSVGDRVRTARPTPEPWYGEGVGTVQSVEFRKILPYVGGLRGRCVYTVDFEDAVPVTVPEPYLRRASP